MLHPSVNIFYSRKGTKVSKKRKKHVSFKKKIKLSKRTNTISNRMQLLHEDMGNVPVNVHYDEIISFTAAKRPY